MVTGVSFSGLASGLDTDEIMEKLMQIESRPLRQLQQKQKTQQMQQEAWQNVNMMLSGLDSSLGSLRRSTTFGAFQVRSSREDLLTATATQAADEADYQVQVKQLAEAHRLASGQFSGQLGEHIDFSGFETGGETHFDIVVDEESEMTEQIAVYETDTLRDIRDRINAAEDSGVRASVVDDRLVLTSAQTGSSSTIQLQQGPDNILEALDVMVDDTYQHQLSEARDAQFTVDGLQIDRQNNVGIDDVIDGVTLDLQGASEGETLTLSVRRDSQQAADAVQQFAEEYNKVQNHISRLAGRDGLLAGDGTLRRLQSSLRTHFTASVQLEGEHQYSMLSQVGVEVDRDGEMSVDEAKLSEALAQNPEDVRLLFAADEDADGADGAARRLGDYLTGYLRYGDGILDRRDAMFDRMLRGTAERIEAAQRRLDRKETSLLRQFTQMERMLSDLQSQGQWLQGQLQNLPGVSRSE